MTTTRPRVRDDLLVRELPDGCAALDLRSDVVVLLNPSAAYVMSMCDGTRTEPELVTALREAVPALDASAAARDVRAALEQLANAGVLRVER